MKLIIRYIITISLERCNKTSGQKRDEGRSAKKQKAENKSEIL